MKRSLFMLMAVFFMTIICSMELSAKGAANLQEQLKGDTVKAMLEKAQSLAREGNVADASKIYTGIMQSHPDNREAVIGWLMINVEKSPDMEEAGIKKLAEIENQYPRNSALLFIKSFWELEHKHMDEALKDAEKLIKLQPGNAENYLIKGSVLIDQEKYQEALEAYDKATSLNQNIADAWSFKAVLLARLGRNDEAIAASDKAMELFPKGFYNRACMYSVMNDKPNALKFLKMAIEGNPEAKNYARGDKDFKNLYEDEDFRKLTEP